MSSLYCAVNVRRLVLASSSEVYQTPPKVPTDETAPLSVPDPTNPRYSYGGGKIISELMAINYGRKFFDRVLIFRPHNVYGPDMGFEHVIPQFALRLKRAMAQHKTGTVPFEMHGDGRQTRSFCHVDDLVRGVLVMRDKGDITSANIFESILEDEEHHIDYLDTQLELVEKLGEALYIAQLIEQPES